MSFIWPYDKSFGKDADRSQSYVVLNGRAGVLSRKNIDKVSFDLKVVADWSDHEKFASISAEQDFGFVEPGVGCKVSDFG